jgi:hypothetical protein
MDHTEVTACRDQEAHVPPRIRHHPAALWAARIIVLLVCCWNLTAAIPFVLDPSGHVRSFEVSDCGVGGELLVRGLGVAFLMWQVPFIPVIWRPGRNRVCFCCLLGMQAIGLAGETLMLAGLPDGHASLRAIGWRFIAFDGAGLVGMGLAYAALNWGRTAGADEDVPNENSDSASLPASGPPPFGTVDH